MFFPSCFFYGSKGFEPEFNSQFKPKLESNSESEEREYLRQLRFEFEHQHEHVFQRQVKCERRFKCRRLTREFQCRQQ